MFFIKQLECMYCDTKNPARNTERDRIKEIECIKAQSVKDAINSVYDILERFGGARKLHPKILFNTKGTMWIECDRALKIIQTDGIVDLKCLAIQVEYKALDGDMGLDSDLGMIEKLLGPEFYL